jgi:antitoxin component YwqK of YwqJK toxin-antitoxin module
MKGIWVLFPLILLLGLTSCGQEQKACGYVEKNYQFVGKSMANQQTFIKTYRCMQDTNYSMAEVYTDSLYNSLLHKGFLFKNVYEGPYFMYAPDGSLFVKGFYKFGKHDGEMISYKEGKLLQVGHYDNGIRVGVWKDYHKGNLVREREYDKGGKLIKDTALKIESTND